MEAIKELLMPVGSLPSGTAPRENKTIVLATDTANRVPSLAEVAQTDGVMANSCTEDSAKPSNSRTAVATDQLKATPCEKKKPRKWETARRAVSFVVHVVGPGVFVLWGFVLVGVHLAAEFHHTDSPCSLRLKPWLSSKPGCSLVEINCAWLQSNGHDGAIESAWDAFDPDRAAGIVIRHCPALSVSPKIRNYHEITTLKVYNSTIVEWDDAAALTTAHHPSLRTIYMIRTSMPTGELPPGLQSPDFPKGVVSFISCVTNLSSLPNDLSAKWPRNLQLTLDFSELATIPDVITKLQPVMLSLAGAPVSAIPTEILEMPQLLNLIVALLHVEELPRHIGSINPMLRGMMVQYTNVSTFWSWIDHYAHYVLNFPVRLFNAYETPYCRELLEIVNGTRKTFSVAPESDHSVLMDVSTPENLAFAMKSVECTTPGHLTCFPLPAEDAKHAWRPVGG